MSKSRRWKTLPSPCLSFQHIFFFSETAKLGQNQIWWKVIVTANIEPKWVTFQLRTTITNKLNFRLTLKWYFKTVFDIIVDIFQKLHFVPLVVKILFKFFIRKFNPYKLVNLWLIISQNFILYLILQTVNNNPTRCDIYLPYFYYICVNFFSSNVVIAFLIENVP